MDSRGDSAAVGSDISIVGKLVWAVSIVLLGLGEANRYVPSAWQALDIINTKKIIALL